jgi:hypothetical protein
MKFSELMQMLMSNEWFVLHQGGERYRFARVIKK